MYTKKNPAEMDTCGPQFVIGVNTFLLIVKGFCSWLSICEIRGKELQKNSPKLFGGVSVE